MSSRRPGIYYGWPMLAGLSLGETVSWGVLYYAFSVFVRPMEGEMGWSRAEVSGAFSLALLVSGLAAVPVGHWLDARGPRGLMTIGSGLAALLLLAWSRVHSLAALYAVWAGLGLAMAAVLYEPAFAVVATWFERRRDCALTLLTVCGGLASTVFVPLATRLLDRQGWRGAVATLAGILAVTTLPMHALLLRRHPQDLGWLPDGDEPSDSHPVLAAESPSAASPGVHDRTASSLRFRVLALVFVSSSLATAGVAVHLIPYLVERHVPASTAAATVGLMGALQLPGRLLFTSFRDRLSLEAALASVLAAEAVALAILPWSGGGPGLVVFATGFGIAGGLATVFRASAVAEWFDRREYGRVSGLLASLTAGARAAGPLLVAGAYGWAGSYAPVYLSLAALLAVASVLTARGSFRVRSPCGNVGTARRLVGGTSVDRVGTPSIPREPSRDSALRPDRGGLDYSRRGGRR